MPELREQLVEYLKALRLPVVRECFEEQALRATEETSSYERYLFDLVERECETRFNNRVERYLRESRLPLEKSFQTFDLKILPQKVRQQLNAMLDGQFVTRHENVLAFGNPGSGKTHFLCAIGQELIRLGWPVYFAPACLLVQDLLVAKRELRLARKLKSLAKFDVVIIDDIGYVQQNQEEMEVLFTFFSERYERGSVMISSNLPFSQWEQIFKNPMMTVAAIDRLVHRSLILELNLPSYRMAEAKQSIQNQKGNESAPVEGGES